MAKTIKLDQSHCNFVFSAQLRLEQWTVLFRDPGRASRGLSTQEAILGIFERNGWPIPDIVAIREGVLLLVEVDHRYEACIDSMLSYRANSNRIVFELNAFANIEIGITSLQLCFCKIGPVLKPQDLLSRGLIDMVASFETSTLATIYTRLS